MSRASARPAAAPVRRRGTAFSAAAMAALAMALGGPGAALAVPSTGGALAGESAEGAGAVRVPAVLERIARCESGGDPTAVSADGRYRGKYQFARETWRRLGGTGDPAAASEAEQDRIALRLYRAEGTAPWPSCSRTTGSAGA